MPGALSVSIDFRSIQRASGAFAGLATDLAGSAIDSRIIIRAGSIILVRFIAAAAPVKTGALRDSIIWKSTGSQGAGVYGLAYGELVVHGTRPHVIMPRVKKALFWPGAAHPVHSVMHPGTAPNDFVRRGVLAAEPALRVMLAENGRSLLRLVASRAGAA